MMLALKNGQIRENAEENNNEHPPPEIMSIVFKKTIELFTDKSFCYLAYLNC